MVRTAVLFQGRCPFGRLYIGLFGACRFECVLKEYVTYKYHYVDRENAQLWNLRLEGPGFYGLFVILESTANAYNG